MCPVELDVTTWDPTRGGDHDAHPVCAALTATILWHPDTWRIGCQARLVPGRGSCSVSRLEPEFTDDRPLADPRVSRPPLQLVPGPDGSLEPVGSVASG